MPSPGPNSWLREGGREGGRGQGASPPPPLIFIILRERALPLTTAIEKGTWKKNPSKFFATPRIQLRLLKCLIWDGVSDVSMGLFRGGGRGREHLTSDFTPPSLQDYYQDFFVENYSENIHKMCCFEPCVFCLL